MTMKAVLLVLLAGVSSCAGNLALKYSRMNGDVGGAFLSSLTNPFFLVGLGFYGVNVLLFAKALDDAPVSVAYPILAGSGFALLAVMSAILFSERMSLSQGVGLILVLAGIVLLAREV